MLQGWHIQGRPGLEGLDNYLQQVFAISLQHVFATHPPSARPCHQSSACAHVLTTNLQHVLAILLHWNEYKGLLQVHSDGLQHIESFRESESQKSIDTTPRES